MMSVWPDSLLEHLALGQEQALTLLDDLTTILTTTGMTPGETGRHHTNHACGTGSSQRHLATRSDLLRWVFSTGHLGSIPGGVTSDFKRSCRGTRTGREPPCPQLLGPPRARCMDSNLPRSSSSSATGKADASTYGVELNSPIQAMLHAT